MTPMHLRGLCLLVFSVVIVFSVPGLYRTIRNRTVIHDEARCGFFFASLVNCGFYLRWFVAPMNDNVVFILLSMALALALYYLILLYQWRGKFK